MQVAVILWIAIERQVRSEMVQLSCLEPYVIANERAYSELDKHKKNAV